MKFVLKSIILCSINLLIFNGILFTYTLKAQTIVKITIPKKAVLIDPMIYGQMLENVNDSMIYGGVVDLSGNVRKHLIPDLQDLKIPVMRWPGGTVVHEYHWENGIGPRNLRPTVPNLEWNGIENYQFGTDEFLQWCEEIGTEPYINFNMGNQPQYKGTLGEALTWIEYVNGGPETPYGKLRITNGREKPYNVRYWCLGNENYLTSRGGGHIRETETVYAAKLKQWAGTIRNYYPDLQLLGIGQTLQWNQKVLEECGNLVDFLTQHYYVNSKIQDGKIQNPTSTLFAPAKMEAHLALLGAQLDKMNQQLGRSDKPIRLSVDEWNNRHSINEGDQFKFSRQDPRRQFDVAVVAGMLNAFIRQSPHVGMANYIFPVNAHGLIRTVGNTDAYLTALYPVFNQYRQWMIGSKLEVNIEGTGVLVSEIKPTIDGDADETKISGEKAAYIDASAVIGNNNIITVALVNRNDKKAETVTVHVPKNYVAKRKWILEHQDINMANTAEKRNEIGPRAEVIETGKLSFETEITACGLQLVQFEKKR
jgi:alpha-N-arabinofuranosidase